jgi:hypothetical protein
MYVNRMKNIFLRLPHHASIFPDNVGFDNQGKVKLFDFGLAREVHDNDNCGNGTYKLTPNTGSLRIRIPLEFCSGKSPLLNDHIIASPQRTSVTW